MAKHPRIDVILTSEGKAALEEAPFYKLTVTKYGTLNCESVEDRGMFQRLRLTLPPVNDRAVTFELDIPTHYILYMMTAVPEARRQLGFKE